MVCSQIPSTSRSAFVPSSSPSRCVQGADALAEPASFAAGDHLDRRTSKLGFSGSIRDTNRCGQQADQSGSAHHDGVARKARRLAVEGTDEQSGQVGREPAILSYRDLTTRLPRKIFLGLSLTTQSSQSSLETCASHVTFQAERRHLHSRER